MNFNDLIYNESEREVAVLPLPPFLKLIKEGVISSDALNLAYQGESVGLDLHYVNENGNDFIIPNEMGTIAARDLEPKVLLPTGIKVNIPVGYVGLILERGSVIKTSLKLRAGVIDPGFTGEVMVNALSFVGRDEIPGVYINHGTRIKNGTKLPFQLIVVPAMTNFVVVNEDTYNALTAKAKRKSGMVGSSDK